MAWSISITPEGWSALYEACHAQDASFLRRAIIENARQRKIKGRSKWRLGRLRQQTLADWAYDLIKDNDTCDNGGFKYWVDPAGYYKIVLP